MMRLAARFAPGVLLGVALSLGAGCALFQKKAPVAATSLQVLRRAGGDGSDAKAVRQKLVIDLTNGRATLTDTDMLMYPHQVDAATLEGLRAAVAGRTWQVGTLSPAEGAADATRYTLTVYNQGQPLRSQAQWAEPPRKPLPEVLLMLERAFELADRVAHPLSDRVDLVPQ